MSETVRFRYSSSKNIKFNGVIETDITREEWAEMSAAEQDDELGEALNELVDIYVEGE